MAIKGSIAKEEIIKRMMEVFEDSFMNDKTLIIPMMENGEEVQIKLTLTASKTNIPHSNGKAEIPAAVAAGMPKPVEVVEPTEGEKQRVVDLINKLGSI